MADKLVLGRILADDGHVGPVRGLAKVVAARGKGLWQLVGGAGQQRSILLLAVAAGRPERHDAGV